MKILFPTDGSDPSVAALRHLTERLAWFLNPQIALINVHLPLPYARAVAWAGKEAVHGYYDEEGNEALAPGAAVLDQQGIVFERVLRVGDPAQEIVRFAREWNADLVALGRHGHSAMAEMFLGSVAQKVIAASPIPVMIFEERRREE